MTKDERRAAMPIVSAFIDEYRNIFGELNGIKATENNHTVTWRKTKKGKGDLAGVLNEQCTET